MAVRIAGIVLPNAKRIEHGEAIARMQHNSPAEKRFAGHSHPPRLRETRQHTLMLSRETTAIDAGEFCRGGLALVLEVDGLLVGMRAHAAALASFIASTRAIRSPITRITFTAMLFPNAL
jgi:hypothetical protein